MPLITARNREIHEAHKKGISYGKLAKEYSLSAQRIQQICNDVERGIYNPSTLFSLLDSHYPDISTRTTHGAVYVIYRYINRTKDKILNYTLDDLMEGFNSIPTREYRYVYGMGEKKLRFLQQLNEDYKFGRI